MLCMDVMRAAQCVYSVQTVCYAPVLAAWPLCMYVRMYALLYIVRFLCISGSCIYSKLTLALYNTPSRTYTVNRNQTVLIKWASLTLSDTFKGMITAFPRGYAPSPSSFASASMLWPLVSTEPSVQSVYVRVIVQLSCVSVSEVWPRVDIHLTITFFENDVIDNRMWVSGSTSLRLSMFIFKKSTQKRKNTIFF